jgi:excisionase family DNA binding protein
MEEMLNIREVSKVLSVHPNTVVELIKAGDIPGYKVGGNRVDKDSLNFSTSGIRFKAQDVREYLTSVLIR